MLEDVGMSNPFIVSAIEYFGSAKAMADALDVWPTLITQWKQGDRPISILRAAQIEKLTGGTVSKRLARPNDWWLIWPDLVDDDHPIPTEPRVAA